MSAKQLTHLSLFSGIGGLDLAAEMAGFVTVGQCEWADYPTKVLEKHWPDVPRWRDIRTLTKESFYERTGLRTVDVISGGFPCQPFSVAGKHRGKEDDRYLWPEMLRVIGELRPTWVLGENVPGIVNLALDEVLSDLEDIGYKSRAFIVPACGVDAPHRRDRACIMAHSVNWGGLVRRDEKLQDLAENGGQGPDHGGGAQELLSGQWREDEPGSPGVADGIRTAVHEHPSPDADCVPVCEGEEDQILVTECSCRERERAPGDRYRHQLHELVECTPLGKIGLLNPNWIEWLMGYPIGWTELDASETRSSRSSSTRFLRQ